MIVGAALRGRPKASVLGATWGGHGGPPLQSSKLDELEFGFDVASRVAQVFEVEETVIQQVRGSGVAERVQHRRADVWNLQLKVRDQLLDASAFQVRL